MTPWVYSEEWREMMLSVERIGAALGDSRRAVMEVVGEMCDLYAELDGALQMLCSATCPDCVEVCCQKATVWYDMKDVLFLYHAAQRFPEHQVRRNEDGSCCFLAADGCVIPRSERPFICTWYLCSAQTALLSAEHELTENPDIRDLIRQLKHTRNRLEDLCIQAAAGPI